MDSKSDQLIPTRPYLIRAIREWVIDNGLTPQLLVDVEADNVVIPEGYAQDGKILLNVHTRAVNALELGNEFISFSTRFGGVSQTVQLPVQSILAIFARENGHGYSFREEAIEPRIERIAHSSEEDDQEGSADRPDRPHLYVVE